MPTGLILGIESSCDETSASIVRNGREVLSNVVASQLIHGNYGGVVPELASREHLRNIVPVVHEALERASAATGHPITYADLDAIAVTEGPGLAGALLVGITFAKALSLGTGLPLIAVNHLEGHIHAVLMDAAISFPANENASSPPELPSTNLSSRPKRSAVERPVVRSATNLGAPFLTASSSPAGPHDPHTAAPLLALVVSGGHTHLYLATPTPQQTWTYRNIGRTLDDAAGEAYDKVAKLLGLPYPGGPWMDALAPHGDPRSVPFTFAQLKNKGRPAPKLRRDGHSDDDTPRFDFSFSGIKTAVLRYVELHHMKPRIAEREARLKALGPDARPTDPAVLALFDTETLNLIASFQHSVTGYLTRQAFNAAEACNARGLLVTGGVAANRELRRRIAAEAARRGLPVAFPQIALSTDNAAMIAAAAWPKWLNSNFAPDTLEPTPQLRLG